MVQKRKMTGKHPVLRLAALLVAMPLILGGCQLFSLQPDLPPDPEMEEDEQVWQVVDDSRRAEPVYEREAPAIDADPFLGTPVPVAVQAQTAKTRQKQGEIRSVWLSYLELDALLKNKTASAFRSEIGKVYDNVAAFGLNTVVVHVRPFGDALYASSYFPWSYLASGAEGKNPGFDPLEIMVEEAKKRGLRLEAWINPYRVRAAGSTVPMSADNPAAKWLQSGGDQVIRYDGVTSYNPANPQAQKLIVDGVREIVRGYDVDAIHIDDYFYPTTDAAFDAQSYAAYKQGGGKLDLADWRRSNVESLIRQIYTAVKEENPKVLFGISPESSLDTNYNRKYLDVEKIAAGTGYCDYLCPQIYFGFQNAVQPYAKTLAAWENLVTSESVDLYVGLAVYKTGKPDSYAGAGSAEWVNSSNLISRMIGEARGKSSYGGFVLYRYDSVFSPDSSVSAHVKKEMEQVKALLD